MATLWYAILVAMLGAYVVLDGFDLGVGALYLLLAKPEERPLLLRAIGPYWDGNEVWLLAAGGVLFLAFPSVYASALSGFYLPLMLALWLLILRGLSIELRGHLANPLWHSFWDATFSLASALLALVLGVALGNVLRGVPLDGTGYFFVPFWTDLRTGGSPGAIDWYTLLVGTLALAALSAHGARYLALRTEGQLQLRSRRTASWLEVTVAALTALALPATAWVRPASLDGFRWGPWGTILFALACAGWLGAQVAGRLQRDLAAFVGSCAFLAGMFASAAVGLYPFLLPASGDARLGLTIQGAAAGPYALSVALGWWCFGTVLVVGYFAIVFRTFRGKVTAADAPYGT
jgi:cytochrome d ubiquinol oxidase subunit II